MARRVSGLRALHDIDSAIGKARNQVTGAAHLPGRVSGALAENSRQQAQAYTDIAKVRLAAMEGGELGGSKNGDALTEGSLGAEGSLGYVDRQAAKLLRSHTKEEQRILNKADKLVEKIEGLEKTRHPVEKSVAQAVKAYEKAVDDCIKSLRKNPTYVALEKAEQRAEDIVHRARAKHELSLADVDAKGKPYRNDPYFAYLQKRNFGTRDAKGWLLTKWLDSILARRGHYRDALLNYKKLTDIPVRLASHVEALIENHESAEIALQDAENKAMAGAGVGALKKASMAAQKKLDAIDADIQAIEQEHQELRSRQAAVSGGNSVPYKEATELLVNTLKRKDLPSLRRLAVHTTSIDDDHALSNIGRLMRQARELREDQEESLQVLSKYQEKLTELEQLRRKYKNHRYDAPTSDFPNGNIVGPLLGQLLAGLLSSSDVWRQIERAQRTVRRGTGGDFGGVDWGDAMRLPRNTGSRSGGWSGGRSTRRAPRRTSRRSTPSRSSGRGSRGGGFRTGGGF